MAYRKPRALLSRFLRPGGDFDYFTIADELSGNQNPRPVSAKNADTRAGHPRELR